MTNAIKKSLEENQEHILENLPKEFHDDFKASLDHAAPIAALSEDEAKKQAIELIKEHPEADDEAFKSLVEKADVFISTVEPASQEELDALQKELHDENEALIKSRLDAGLDACPHTEELIN